MAAGARFIAGVDEVGRGALAGPVSVGAVIVDAASAQALEGVHDSKLLSAGVRERLVSRIHAWSVGYGVGHAEAEEIDALGLSTALRLAGYRALRRAMAMAPGLDAVILDGSFNWLDSTQSDLFAALHDELVESPLEVPVRTRVKADMNCQSVAAASVLAKVERDALMRILDQAEPGFGWAENKGYGTAAHRAQIVAGGPSAHHRRTWNLTGKASTPEV